MPTRRSLLRPLALVLAALGLAVVACSSSSPNATPAGSAGACGDGYLPATNGACLKGTCPLADAGVVCCSSQCATCEDKGLISTDDGGGCPPGDCISGDLTVALTCCDVCPGDDEGGAGEASAGDATAGQDGSSGSTDAGADADATGDSATD